MGKRGPQKAPKPTRNWTDAMSSKRGFTKAVIRPKIEAVAVSTEVDWEPIRVARVQEGLPFSELSKRFGVPESEIAAKSIDEAWPIPGAVAEHAVVSQVSSMAEQALHEMQTWMDAIRKNLVESMERLSKLPPIDPETVTEEELSHHTRILSVLQKYETLWHTHVSRGAKVSEMERAKHEENKNPATVDMFSLIKFASNPPKDGILASNAVVIDVTEEPVAK